MNTGNIKKYAPKARSRFIETMTRQAARYGISAGHKGEGHVAPAEVRGDVLLISALDGQTHSFPKALRGPREALTKWVTQLGFEQAMEQAAYSWFNRLCAIRFMELKGYLDHGRRVLSHPDHEGGFQILDDCLEIDLPGMDTARIRELKLDGTQDEALYRELLLAQCHALHEAMPFLFEPLDDASELLLPDNLTKTDSLIRELVEAIPEEDWQDVEVIGWLYQFYIAEKKDQVIGKVVKSEDIPAATQLFTPNWIVQYLVQNSVGRQWLQTYPDSSLKGHMPYYIEPAEQEPEVQAKLDAITPESLDPETIKVLDPACGSGHILVEAYNVLKAIYEERGYRSRDIPKLILENNLFGLDIDDRASQLSSFALLMKAREEDRRIFSRGIRLNVMALQSTQNLDASTLWRDLNLTGDWHQGQSQSLFENEQKELSSNDNTYKAIVDLIERFQDAKTLGSLIEVPNNFEVPLSSLLEVLTELDDSGDIMQKTAAKQVMPVVHQAWLLAQRYDAVIANPPYLSRKGMDQKLKNYLINFYPDSKYDVYASFMERGFYWLKEAGYNSMVTMQSWMFLSSYAELRSKVLSKNQILLLMQIGYNSFPELNSKIVQCSAMVARKNNIFSYNGTYIDLNSAAQSANKRDIFLERSESNLHIKSQDKFVEIPGYPIAYWASESVVKSFSEHKPIEENWLFRQGMATSDNERFLRYWFEVDKSKIDSMCRGPQELNNSNKKWFPFNKGGDYRKWYGNNEIVVNWESDGKEMKEFTSTLNQGMNVRLKSRDYYCLPCVTYSAVSTGDFSCRISPPGFLFDTSGGCLFGDNSELEATAALLNSSVAKKYLDFLCPTISFSMVDIKKIPYIYVSDATSLAIKAKNISKNDWDGSEVSPDFNINPLVEKASSSSKVSHSFIALSENYTHLVKELRDTEREINKLFVEVYSLDARTEVDIGTVSLNANPFYRYSGAKEKEINELIDRFDSDIFKDLICFAIGCMMGRYSLDKPGLILASQGKTIRDYLAEIPQPCFTPDKNAIIPLTDQEWFPGDATNRFRDFVRTVWSEEHLEENLDFVAERLCLHAIKPKKGETALDTIRRYLSTQFFKDHLRTYKKRPIYWLFSSGKEKAFECLVYLHRYNESTLAEMRTDYVIPLITKLAGYVDKLEQDKESSSSAAEAKGIEKELSKLYKQQTELNAFDEKLRHYADQRISLDLDDGVKVNYGKFGDLLAEVKQIAK